MLPFVHDEPETGSIENLFESNVWQVFKDSSQTIGSAKLSINYDNNTITLSGNIPGITKDSNLYFVSNSYDTNFDYLCE